MQTQRLYSRGGGRLPNQDFQSQGYVVGEGEWGDEGRRPFRRCHHALELNHLDSLQCAD